MRDENETHWDRRKRDAKPESYGILLVIGMLLLVYVVSQLA